MESKEFRKRLEEVRLYPVPVANRLTDSNALNGISLILAELCCGQSGFWNVGDGFLLVV